MIITPYSRAPWQPGVHPLQIHDTHGFLVATIHDLEHRSRSETQANHRLILAAPLLFAAALDALHYVYVARTILAQTPNDQADFAACEVHLKRAIGLALGQGPVPEAGIA